MITISGMQKALEILQPVTPTDGDHPAHWWNEGIGQVIRNTQMLWIENVKEALLREPTMENVKETLTKEKIAWPSVNDGHGDYQHFWNFGFGSIIIAHFSANFIKFQRQVIEYHNNRE
jgi:hypothetical protein